MHIKDSEAEAVYKAWELDSKDKGDILEALAEAFMRGASAGGMDHDLFEEALSFNYKEKENKEHNT